MGEHHLRVSSYPVCLFQLLNRARHAVLVKALTENQLGRAVAQGARTPVSHQFRCSSVLSNGRFRLLYVKHGSLEFKGITRPVARVEHIQSFCSLLYKDGLCLLDPSMPRSCRLKSLPVMARGGRVGRRSFSLCSDGPCSDATNLSDDFTHVKSSVG